MIQNEKVFIALHENAKRVSLDIRKREVELLTIIEKIDRLKVYRAYKYPSLFKYLTLSLGFSESRAYDFTCVARAFSKFSKLRESLNNEKISISKARRIIPVLDENNQDQWLLKAHLNTHRNLEKLVASENPETEFKESVRMISENQLEVKLIMSQAEFKKFKRAQDIQCQKNSKQISLKDTFQVITTEFLKREDPVVRAARRLLRKNKKPLRTCQVEPKKPSLKRNVIPRLIFHKVQLRDQGRCQKLLPAGEKCLESKWVDIHHIKPVKFGGPNSLDNLVTLCRGHHQVEHWQRFT